VRLLQADHVPAAEGGLDAMGDHGDRAAIGSDELERSVRPISM
jgi:hypothetical protein